MVNYAYTIVPGQLNLMPTALKFDPGFAGFEQVKELEAKSTFD